jgi:16S rRNA (guanine527-N7)-methyltransferase
VPDTDHEGHSPTALHEVLLAAREAGFLGPGPIERHLRHAQAFATLARSQPPVPTDGRRPRLLDLGSGGGLPGLVIATEWPEATLVLLEANHRRAVFLGRAVSECGLDQRASVVNERAELCGRDPSYRGTFDGVVARSFGAPAVVAECAAPFLRPGGWVIVSEPPGASEGAPGTSVAAVVASDPADATESASRWPVRELARLGLEPGEFVRADFGYQVLYQRVECPERYPRRNGVPAKNPLF